MRKLSRRTDFFNMNPALVVLASSLLSTVAAQSHDHHDMAWVNGYRQSFNFQCPHGEVLVAIRSYFSEQDGSDRLWTFECQPTPEGLGEPSDCWWDDISRAGMEWWVLCLISVIYLLVEHLLSTFLDFYSCVQTHAGGQSHLFTVKSVSVFVAFVNLKCIKSLKTTCGTEMHRRHSDELLL